MTINWLVKASSGGSTLMTMLLIVNLVVDLFLLLVFEMHLLEHPPFEDADQGEADYDKEDEEMEKYKTALFRRSATQSATVLNVTG